MPFDLLLRFFYDIESGQLSQYIFADILTNMITMIFRYDIILIYYIITRNITYYKYYKYVENI